MQGKQVITKYVDEVNQQFSSGHAREHAYRPALQRLMDSIDDCRAINEPKRSEFGNPDFIFLKRSNTSIIKGYAEAKDITETDLDKITKTEQLHRYGGYNKLFLTNYLEFRFYRNGEEYERINVGKLHGGSIKFDESQFGRLVNELQAFLELPPEPIKSGKQLSIIMGQKGRRIRDSVSRFLRSGSDKNQELERIYKMMKELLVHDLTTDKFADMYAQTLVYGLFAARYNDKNPDSFKRSNASELVPASNPFLREFFAHIGGIHFDQRLAHVVDELCEVFAVSNVDALVHKHLRLFEVENEKDPIIHFYEDFLKEYDPAERKKMGAYYTPVPVVRFIIRQVDEILKEEFGLSQGLTDTATINHTISDSGGKKHTFPTHKVQILDPAVGTATFLNEIIKHIHQGFEGQEGRWPAYAEEELLPRLYGFELMMAPYTIAHLKLGMTLQETGITNFKKRLGVYLTNTLEEGVKRQQELFTSVGLAEAVSHEANEAAKIKHERPIMIVIGNPPYSVSSNNKNEYIDTLVAAYKKDLNEKNIQPLSDDYIKFIRFAESMIIKNGEGIVAMITNNSYLDGLIHRQMRKHLTKSFNKIYILNLHGDSKKGEVSPDGSKDSNVFDIQQGVSIIIAVKNKKQNPRECKVKYAELFGDKRTKFSGLNEFKKSWETISSAQPNYYFIPKDETLLDEYSDFIKISDLMPVGDVGVSSYRDQFVIDFNKQNLNKRIIDFYELSPDEVKSKYKIKFTQGPSLSERQSTNSFEPNKITKTTYRPFDERYIYYSNELIDRPRTKTASNLIGHENLALVTIRRSRESVGPWRQVFIADKLPSGSTTITSLDRNYVLPLYIYHEDGTRTPNLDSRTLKKLTANLSTECSPENIIDYIYATLHSSSYREKYREFLKSDFPRVPLPQNNGQFNKLVVLGERLRALHLMKAKELSKLITTFPIGGKNAVEVIKYDDEKVWINNQQYFGNVPKLAWDFFIGGYQPAQKWLKDRKSSQLSNADIEHYQKIISVLVETGKIMKEIDEVGAM